MRPLTGTLVVVVACLALSGDLIAQTSSSRERSGHRAGATARRSGASTVLLRGRVRRADSDTPIPYSTIDITSASQRHFSDDQGTFSFKLVPGMYRVQVRQLGFAPWDTVVALTANGSIPVLVARLRAITVSLRTVHVKGMQHCTRAGVDSVEDREVLDLLTEMRENAQRELLLRRGYRFAYLAEARHTITMAEAAVPVYTALDTLRYFSDTIRAYQHGGTIFVDRTDPRGAWERMRVPGLIDIVDQLFIASHCFGSDVAESGEYVLTFRPLDSLSTSDVEGTVRLDSARYIVRSIVVHLTKPTLLVPEVDSMEVQTAYQEVLPGMALAADITATQRFRGIDPDTRRYIATERQTICQLRFLTEAPVGVPKSMTVMMHPSAASGSLSPPLP